MRIGWRFAGSRGSESGKRGGGTAARRRPPAGPPPRRILHDDETGVFPIVEAILVAVLVLTAILFLTSVQRPTLGAEEAGLDLGQVSSDSLRLLQSTQQFGPFDQWVTSLVNGDEATAAAIHRYLAGTRGDGVLPKGALYQLRLDNGISSIPILPAGGAEAPRGARAAHVTLLPNWTAFKDRPAPILVEPGQVIESGAALPLVDTSTTCANFRSPLGSTHMVDLNGTGGPDSWTQHWKAAPSSSVPWKGTQHQVPLDVPYGTWAADCGGTTTYFRVLRPAESLRTGTVNTVKSPLPQPALVGTPAGFFTDADEGKPVTGFVLSNSTRVIPLGAKIDSIAGDGTTATLNQPALFNANNVVVTIGASSPYAPYGLQLVVWFGA